MITRTLRQMSHGGQVAIGVLIAIAVLCILAPVVAVSNPMHQPDIILLASQAPSAAHPFGTDLLSRDVLSRVLHGGRVTLGVALIATLVSVTLGTVYGAVAGYATGFKGTLMLRVLDALLSIPRVLLLIAIFALWVDPPPVAFILILGATGWYALARLVRGHVLAFKQQDFVLSAIALGASHGRVVTRHILPNVVTAVVVAATLGIGQVIILEAGLSYLGIGLRPPNPSWGNMIHDVLSPGQIAAHWWMWLAPGLAIVMTVLAFNVAGDALLRALQPRQTGNQ